MKKEGECSLCLHRKTLHVDRLLLAVQKERDRLGRQRTNNYSCRAGTAKVGRSLNDGQEDDEEDDLSVAGLLRAERTAKEVREETVRVRMTRIYV